LKCPVQSECIAMWIGILWIQMSCRSETHSEKIHFILNNKSGDKYSYNCSITKLYEISLKSYPVFQNAQNMFSETFFDLLNM
jgi:hypothetical protein